MSNARVFYSENIDLKDKEDKYEFLVWGLLSNIGRFIGRKNIPLPVNVKLETRERRWDFDIIATVTFLEGAEVD